jgi:hypothetical protein
MVLLVSCLVFGGVGGAWCFFATRGAAAPGGPDVCVMRLFATALAGEQRACICTAAGWFLGRREARGDRFCKDNFGCIAGLDFEGSGIERRRFHGQARGDEARRALQG